MKHTSGNIQTLYATKIREWKERKKEKKKKKWKQTLMCQVIEIMGTQRQFLENMCSE